MQHMKSSTRRSLVVSTLTLMGVSVLVAQVTPQAGKGRARRMIHHHEGPAPRAGGRLGDPLPDLTQEQLSAFTNGLGEF